MRVLVVAAPLTGHLLPLVPLATALSDRGHEVFLASGSDPSTAGSSSTGGLPVHDVSDGLTLLPIGLRLLLRHPRLARLEMQGLGGTAAVRLMFGAIGARMADDTVALARAVRPDLVVHEPLAATGPLAAAAVGVPSVLVDNLLWDGSDLVEKLATTDEMAAARARHGLPLAPEPALVVTIAPESVVGPRPGIRMRHGGPPPTTREPLWMLTPPERPRLLVSYSTVGGPGGGIEHVRRVVEVAGDVDADIVLVRAPEKLLRAALPRNVRTVGWVPLDAAMGCATAVVHHSGAGTTFGAMTAGIPQLMVVGSGDRLHNARIVVRRGCALAMTASEITAEHLTTLLTAQPLKKASLEVSAEVAATPDATAVAADLPALVS
jgi:UDP:flavonoid glycosyltransferase YjiC (YdhE family)